MGLAHGLTYNPFGFLVKQAGRRHQEEADRYVCHS
jgi:hypothetical protein